MRVNLIVHEKNEYDSYRHGKLIMMRFSLKPISGKYFIGIIIGLIIANIIGSVVVPAHFVLDAPNLGVGYGVLGSKLIMSHTFAVSGIFYLFVVSPNLFPSVILGSVMHILVILSIISIPFTMILSKGIKTYKRIFYIYLIHIEILTLFTWWWIPNFGFS
jgi:hypothetical protein